MKRSVAGLLLAFLVLQASSGNTEPGPSRAEEQQRMLRIFPKSEPWEHWLQKTGELPPDFERMPSVPGLPDPLVMQDGRRVESREEWPERRRELLDLFQHYVFGRVPPPPGNGRAVDIESRETESITLQDLVLEFGPEYRAKLHVQLMIPKGEGPFPVFITQDYHYRWAMIAASRGYIGCVYAGADTRDDTGAFVDIWPEYDWTKLARRAWAASRCIDYLVTLPQVDKEKIALTGHSRNGKLSLIAAALDERITAVISSSSGAGGSLPYRCYSEAQFGEGIELLTRAFPDWMHPRLRFFAGREEKLPIDQHELIACIAPRPCLLSTALNDNVESVWAIEQAYHSARSVYTLLGAENALQLRYRPGAHAVNSEDLEAYVDWLDAQWNRGEWFVPGRPLYPTYQEWLNQSRISINPEDYPEAGGKSLLSSPGGKPIETARDWDARRGEIRNRLREWMGQPPYIPGGSVGQYGAEENYRAALLGRGSTPKDLQKISLNFGHAVSADLYHSSATAEAKCPGVLWLPPLSNAHGYIPAYRSGPLFHLELARAGFAVLAYDQIGNGHRVEEIARFYERYPEWSVLGKMVLDARNALDVFEQIPFVDREKIYVAGYGLGAIVGLHAAALDERIRGVVSIAGFTPMRSSARNRPTGMVERLSTWLPLEPKLGFFVGQETRIPYDYPEVLAAIAPRPVRVLAPAVDGQSNPEDLRACVEEAGEVYRLLGKENGVQLQAVEDFNRLSEAMQQAAISGLKEIASE